MKKSNKKIIENDIERCFNSYMESLKNSNRDFENEAGNFLAEYLQNYESKIEDLIYNDSDFDNSEFNDEIFKELFIKDFLMHFIFSDYLFNINNYHDQKMLNQILMELKDEIENFPENY